MANDIALSQLKSLASYSDLNRNLGQEGEADILLDHKAISQSLFNIFRTHIGEAGPIFMPDFGSSLPYLLQEPLDQITALSVSAAAIQTAQKWETRIDVDVGQTQVATDYNLPGYIIRMVYTIRKTGQVGSTNIPLSQRNSNGTSVVGPPASNPAWYPTNLTNLEVWFDGADSKSVVQSISSMSRWKDKSGKANHSSILLTDPAANRFSMKQGSINGLSSIRLATGSTPNTLKLTKPVTFNHYFHIFVVARNDYPSFKDGDTFGFSILPETSVDQTAGTFRVAYGIGSAPSLPSIISKQAGTVTPSIFAKYVSELNNTVPNFLELEYDNGTLNLYINHVSKGSTTGLSLAGLTSDTLLASLDAVVGDPSLYVGEVIVINGETPIPVTEVTRVREYFYSKWLSEAVNTPPTVVQDSVISDVFLTSVLLPQTSPATREVKIVLQHTRTSKPQPIQFKLVATGPGVLNAKSMKQGTLLRYSSAMLVEDNPDVYTHSFSQYTNAQLSGPFGNTGPWNELLNYGLVFVSTASNSGRTELIVSFPTGVDIAYPGVAFDDVTLSVIALGSTLSNPVYTTFHLEPLLPVASFYASKVLGAAPLVVTFNDTSSGPATQWEWSFKNDGHVDSIDKIPTYAYHTPGVYSVALKALNVKGESSTVMTQLITVTQPSAIDPYLEDVALLLHAEASEGSLTVIDSSTQNSVVQLVGATHVTTANKKMGVGSLNIPDTTSGIYASSTFDTFDDFVYETWVFAPSLPETCALLALEGGPGYWLGVNMMNSCLSVGIGPTLTVGTQLFIPGVWNHVALTKRNGLLQAWMNGFLSDTQEDASVFVLLGATVAHRPYVGAPVLPSLYDEVRLTLNHSRYVKYFDLPTGPFPDAYGLPPLPVVNFTSDVTTGPLPLTVHFTDLTTNLPNSWKWEFETPGVINSLSQNPSHTFTLPGTYSVKLTAENSRGKASHTIVGMITLQAAPVAKFTSDVTTGLVPLTVQFTDISTGNPTAWQWDFGDSTTSALPSPSHVYAAAGNYTVSLVVSNSFGSTISTANQYIKVTELQPPLVNFVANPTLGAAPMDVVINNLTSGTVDSYLWDFGDGTTSTLPNP